LEEIEWSFSVCFAISRSVSLSFPVFSQALTIPISVWENDHGKASKQSERVCHSLSIPSILERTWIITGFFSCFLSIEKAFKTLTHAFIIVARRRKNISLSFTFKFCIETR